jgi:transposase InsO family protein
MPWECVPVMQQRRDLVAEIRAQRLPVAALARKYGISRQTAYKWLRRAELDAAAGPAEQSRRPHDSPAATAADVVAAVLALRQQHPCWGAAKLRVLVAQAGFAPPGERTVHRIRRRAGLVGPPAPEAPPPQRFERATPNELWQLDFKGRVRLGPGPSFAWGLPLSILDDHARFLVAMQVLPDRQLTTVWAATWAVFGDYGLPQAMLTDNENGLFASHRGGVTTFTMRLWRLGIDHPRGRPYHPQTQGKVERFHGTLQREVLAGQRFADRVTMQTALDDFRDCYNHLRPHEALGQVPPATRYQPSPRPRPDRLPQAQHPAGATLRRVTQAGYVSLRGCRVYLGEGLAGEQVQLADQGDRFSLSYLAHRLRELRWDDLRRDQWL